MRRPPTRALSLRQVVPYAAGAVLVGTLGVAVHADSPLVRLDLALVGAFNGLSPTLTALAGSGTDLAATPAILVVTSTAAASLLLRGQWHGALALGMSVGATQAIVFAIKALVARARPPASASVVDVTGYAFPSAHAASAAALYGLLAFLLLRRVGPRAQLAVATLGVLFVALLGATRVYLGAHYPSDVLAGWLVGGLVAAAAWQLARTLRRRSVPAC